MIERVYIGLGSNQGASEEILRRALRHIEALPGTELIRISSLYRTAAWGKMDQDDFLNQVAEISTALSARDLLAELQDIEIKLGRQRTVRWGPRTIDLDILLYGEDIIQDRELKIPHPYMKERLFVLVPLAEIAPECIFPDGEQLQEVLYRIKARDGEAHVTKLDHD